MRPSKYINISYRAKSLISEYWDEVNLSPLSEYHGEPD